MRIEEFMCVDECIGYCTCEIYIGLFNKSEKNVEIVNVVLVGNLETAEV